MAGYGVVEAWGGSSFGQTIVPNPNSDFVNIGCGKHHGIGLKFDGSIVCWGWNTLGQCNVPSPNSGFVAISAGLQHSMGLKTDGSIVCWGDNGDNQCDVTAPNSGFVAISAGANHSMGLKTDGSVVVWGLNTYGVISVPSPNADFIAVAGGDNHCLALKSDGSMVGWGNNSHNQGVMPTPNSGFAKIAAGAAHNAAIKTVGNLISWGRDSSGEVSDTPPGTDFVEIEANYYHSLALKSDGSMVGWGADTGSVVSTIPDDAPYTAIATGFDFAMALSVADVLLYTGTYNDGTNSGTVNLSNRVLSIGQISEVLMGGVNRPWVQQTTITIDDSDGYFLGTLARGTEWYSGTFDIWAEHGTAWEKMLTGFVPTAAWSYDYGQQTATINVTSMLARAAARSMGYGGGVLTSSGYDPAHRSPFFVHNGTINEISADGTVTVEYFKFAGAPWRWQMGALCWTEGETLGTINQEAYAPAAINSVGSWEGTVVGVDKKYLSRVTFLGGTKDWMKVGRSIVPTVPWPSASGYPINQVSIIRLLDTAIGSMGLTWDATSKTKFESDLLIVPATLTLHHGTEQIGNVAISNGLVPRYFGGQPWVAAVNDIMESVGANWTVSGIGEVHARIKRASALESVTGTVDFNDAHRYLTEAWSFSESEGLSAARVYHEWDDIEQKYMGTAVTDGSFDAGAMLEMSAKWQRDLGGKLLANRSMTWEKAISRLFPLPFPKGDWGSLVPGSLINLINIPPAIKPDYGSGIAPDIAEGKYMITARHYDYMEESVTVDLRQSPPLTGVFILDHSHVDGPDKLY